jgi:hypothetical protein
VCSSHFTALLIDLTLSPDLVVTALLESWTWDIANTLRENLEQACLAETPDGFVDYIFHQCTVIADQPGYGGLGESGT